MKRSIFIILIAIFSLLIIGGIVYFLYNNNKQTASTPQDSSATQQPAQFDTSGTTAPAETTDGSSQQNQATVGTTTPKLLTSSQVQEIISADVLEMSSRKNLQTAKEELVYFDSKQQVFVSADLDGTNQQNLTKQKLASVKEVAFSPSGLEALITFQQSGEKQLISHINLTTERITALDNNIEKAVWSPDGKFIYYKYTDTVTNKGTLSVSNPDGSKYRVVRDFNLGGVDLDWLKVGTTLAFSLQPSGYRKSSIYSMTTDGKNFTKALGDLYGLAALWSPNGKQLIYTSGDERPSSLQLSLANGNGNNAQAIGSVKTLINKCIWSADNVTIYCAVPKQLTQTFVLPDDYLQGRVATEDTFWKIDALTKGVTRLFEDNAVQKKVGDTLETVFPDARKLWFSQDESHLFARTSQGAVWSIELGK